MKSALKLMLGTAAAAMLTFSLGCQPPKPPAPATADEPAAAPASDNMTSNTTASSETPAGETP